MGVTGLVFINIACCLQIMSKLQEIIYPLMHFSGKESRDLWLRIKKIR